MSARYSREEALRRLSETHGKILELALPLHASIEGSPKERGRLVVKAGYHLDSYLPYKSLKRDAVSLGILQGPSDEPVVTVHRRQLIDGKMTTVGVDKLPLEDYPVAEAYFLAVARLIARPSHGWQSRHPSDEV